MAPKYYTISLGGKNCTVSSNLPSYLPWRCLLYTVQRCALENGVQMEGHCVQRIHTPLKTVCYYSPHWRVAAFGACLSRVVWRLSAAEEKNAEEEMPLSRPGLFGEMPGAREEGHYFFLSILLFALPDYCKAQWRGAGKSMVWQCDFNNDSRWLDVSQWLRDTQG